MSQPRRDWSLANVKREREDGRCRVCRSSQNVEMAHLIGRTHDFNWADGKRQNAPMTPVTGTVVGQVARDPSLIVLPERVVPLCRDHHRMYDAHTLDLLGHLTREEEAQAVIDARGLEAARIRLCPSAYGPAKVAA